jgi:uncharacterized membrane protein
MSRTFLLGLLIALALIGVADSVYLSIHAATGAPLVCDIGAGLDGCNQVANSPYSQVMGIPLAYVGVAFYAFFFLVALIAFLRPPHKTHHIVITTLAAASSLASVAFLYIQVALIQALCVYCVLSAVLTFFSLPIALTLLRKHSPVPPAVLG